MRSPGVLASVKPPLRCIIDARMGALIQQGALLVVGFASGAALARGLGPAQRGEYSLVQVFFVLATPALSLGMPISLLSGRAAIPSFRIVGLHIVVATTISATIAFLYFGGGIGLLIGALIIGPNVTSWSELVICRSGRGSWVQPIRTLDVLSSSVIIIILHSANALSVFTATAALFGPTILIRATCFAIGVRGLPSSAKSKLGIEAYRRPMARFWPRELLSVSATYTDIMVAAVLLNRHDLGVYAVASAMGKLALAPFSALYGETVKRACSGAGARAVLRGLLPIPSALVSLAIVTSVAFGVPIVTIVFGEEYVAAGDLLPIFLIAFGLGGAASLIETAVTVIRPGRVSSLPRVAGLLTAAAIWFLGSFWLSDQIVVLVLGLSVLNTVVLSLTLNQLRSGGVHKLLHFDRSRAA